MSTVTDNKDLKHGTWIFNQEVAQVFDDMLDRSIPLYQQALDLMRHIARRTVPFGGTVLDLGVKD
jgi:tRNA (cmo5U34)-methyltransferase